MTTMTRRAALVHRLLPRAGALALGLLAGCGGGTEGTGGGSADTTGAAGGAPLTCTLPELAQARALSPVLIPGCSFSGGGTVSAPTVLRTAEEVAAALRCNGEGQPAASTLGVDMNANDVYVVEYTMSPASAGIEAFDDGTRLTVLTRFRPNCPGDPMPMPMNSTVAWLVPKDATRTIAQASCSLPEQCD